jgi:hypothetical protein
MIYFYKHMDMWPMLNLITLPTNHNQIVCIDQMKHLILKKQIEIIVHINS